MSRKTINILFLCTSYISAGICGLILIFLLGTICFKGIQAINFDFLLTGMSNFGASGGILYQILGSILIVSFAAAMAYPIALGTAIYKSEYIKTERMQKVSSLILYGLNGIPSILFGIFGLLFFVNILNTGISWFVGSIILGLMMLPTITLSAYQSISSVPQIYRESAYSLGMDKWKVVAKVVVPQGINGAITGVLMGIARAIGETAPIMFIATAFSGVTIPSSLVDPVSTLPTHILALAQQATNPAALKNAWGSSFVLICIVLIFTLSALVIRIRSKE